MGALTEFEQYLAMHVERLRHRSADTSILAAVLHDGDLSDTEVLMFAALLLGAGFITTAHVFGKAVVTLIRHPDQLDRLRVDPEGWTNAVEEMLRYETAIQWGGRVATEQLDIQGQTFHAGQFILLLLGGANRDPAIFERPDEFDTPAPTRANTSASAAVFTSVWGRHWHAWNCTSACSRCLRVSPS
jgi:cytochrome P450